MVTGVTGENGVTAIETATLTSNVEHDIVIIRRV